jgi:formate-nitrite transporter family protein
MSSSEMTDDHVAGSEGAGTTLIAYCDFECPYCGEAYVVIKRLQARLGEKLRFIFRHFPLIDKHMAAQQAAEAAEAAGAQGRFWAMHDMLFEHQTALEAVDLYGYAEMTGLNVPQFKDDLHGRRYAGRVMRDIRSGRHAGVSGTPTFLINGKLQTEMEGLERLILQAA